MASVSYVWILPIAIAYVIQHGYGPVLVGKVGTAIALGGAVLAVLIKKKEKNLKKMHSSLFNSYSFGNDRVLITSFIMTDYCIDGFWASVIAVIIAFVLGFILTWVAGWKESEAIA